MDEIVHEFLVESHENLDQLDRDLVALEQEPDSRPLLASVFRTVHTIKGTSGFLAYTNLEKVTHVGEGLLSMLRDGEMELTPEITTVLLQLVDAIRALLRSIEETGGEGDANYSLLITRITAMQQAAAASAERAASDAPTATKQPAETADPGEQPGPRLGERLVEEGIVHPDDVTLAVLEQTVGDQRRIGEILVEHGAVDASTISDVLEGGGDARRSVADSSVRIDVDVLDNLMRLVGELVLTRNQVAGAMTATADLNVVRAWQRLNAIASDLQDGVVKARMQPIDTVWNKLPRMVRDLGHAMGKQVRLELVGGDTELDRTVLEAVKDPIIHLVRNALDHGLEAPAARQAAGKAAEGHLTLRAYHESGQVYIEISDDGAGIDPARIGATAVAKGLLTKEQVAAMSPREVINCIFLPGFSTAERVTNVSGRGVGMDVVKTNMERIGGSVDVQSQVGSGTTFRVKIPLTLAIVSALILVSDGMRFALPQTSVVELVRLEDADRRSRIQTISGAPVYRLRDDLLPLVHLRDVLGQAPLGDDTRRSVYIVVLGTQDRQFGLVVDDVMDTEEIVIKPLSGQIERLSMYAGATILGDGKVTLILDVWGIAQDRQLLTGGAQAAAADDRADAPAEDTDKASVLVVRLADDRLLAVPLDQVTRLEEVPVGNLEQVGEREALQYRGGILPIVRLSGLVSGAQAEDRESLQVVVYTENDRRIGLVVEEILDIAEDALDAVDDIDGPGVAGQTVVQSRVMQMLDMRQAILAADPHFYDAETVSAGA